MCRADRIESGRAGGVIGECVRVDIELIRQKPHYFERYQDRTFVGSSPHGRATFVTE
jgi:hypothetical protein